MLFKVDVFVVTRAAVPSKPIVPTNVLEFAPVSTMGTAIQDVPSGDISTVLSTASVVAVKDAVDAVLRKLSAVDDCPLTRGIALVDSVPRLNVELPRDNGLPNPEPVNPLPLVGITHTRELSLLEILTDCVPIAEPSG